MENLKNLLLENLRAFYKKFYGQDIGPGTEKFSLDFLWISLAFFLAKAISMITNVSAAKILGASEYGKFNLVLSVASLVPFAVLSALAASLVKWGSETDSKETKMQFVNTSLALAIFLLIALTPILIFSQSFISQKLSLSREIYGFGIVYGTLFGFSMISLAIYQIFGEFKKRGWLEVGANLIILSLFFGLVYAGESSYRSLALSYSLAWALIIGIALFKHPIKTLALKQTKTLAPYAMYSFFGGLISFLFIHVQRIMLNHYLSPKEVGVFSVYALGTLNIGNFIGGILYTVFFPKTASIENKSFVWQRLEKALLIGVVSIVLALSGFEWIVLKISGSSYFVSGGLLLLFSLTTAIMIFVYAFATIITVLGTHGLRWNLYASGISGLMGLLIGKWAIPQWHIFGAILAVGSSYLINLSGLFFIRHLLWKRN